MPGRFGRDMLGRGEMGDMYPPCLNTGELIIDFAGPGGVGSRSVYRSQEGAY